MNSQQYDRIKSVGRAIKFKEYILNRDVSSRRIIIEECIRNLEQSHSPKVVAWLINLRSINDQLEPKDRKEQIKVDAYWEEMILEHSKDPRFNTIMELFMVV
jgi:hypothetical protein